MVRPATCFDPRLTVAFKLLDSAAEDHRVPAKKARSIEELFQNDDSSLVKKVRTVLPADSDMISGDEIEIVNPKPQSKLKANAKAMKSQSKPQIIKVSNTFLLPLRAVLIQV